MQDAPRRPAIAIVGIGCRFPGHANSAEQFWQLLCDGVDAVAEIPKDRFDIDQVYDPDPARPGKLYIRRGGFSDYADRFDAAFFRISPREAAQMDPQQRMLLEVAFEAIENAGLTLDRLAGSRTGVFIGLSTHDFANIIGGPLNRYGIESHTATGTSSSLAANRISYTFDLRGPSAAIDTACSSSLTAVHLGCQSLLQGECDLVLAGGVNLFLTPESAIGLAKASMLSPDGVCRAFDAGANGFVRGEGTGIVVLKRFDASVRNRDRVYALIRGSAVNQDGRTAGITAPNGVAQEEMFRDALAVADIKPGDVGYLEAHGTGTVVGDPIEARAIGRVFSAGREPTSPLYLGSAKTNIGHLEAAAGIAGLIKVALCLYHRQIPPHLNFVEPNPAIPFDSLRLQVPIMLQPWPESNRPGIGGVNSFGFGGANAHVLVQEAPAPENPIDADVAGNRPRVLVLSANSQESLRNRARDFAAFLAGGSQDLDDVCHTAAVRRTQMEHRLAIVALDGAEIVASLASFAADPAATNIVVGRTPAGKSPRLALVFSGMGPDLRLVGRELSDREPVFRSVLERCDETLRPLAGWSLLQAFEDSSVISRVGEASFAQIANFALQVGLTTLLRSWNIVPDAVMGHSVGEISAACAAGALTLEDCLRLVFHRGRLVDRLSGQGRMLTAALSEGDAEQFIEPYNGCVSVAAVNTAASVTLSGEAAAMERISAGLAARQVFNRFLAVHVPYHSAALDPFHEEFVESIKGLTPRESVASFMSTTQGRRVLGTDLDAGHWWHNLRDRVRFAEAATALVDEGIEVFLQVGPHPVLQTYLRECVASRSRNVAIVSTLSRGESETTSMLRSCAALHVSGCTVDWDAVSRRRGRCISLPGYSWQHETFGTGKEVAGLSSSRIASDAASHPILGVRLPAARPTWLAQLADARLNYLMDHRIQGMPVYPAAAYVEAALAAGAQLPHGARCSIDNLTFDRMLVLSELREQEIQIACDLDGRFEIHSRSGKGDGTWSLHGRGALREDVSPRTRAGMDIAAARERCTHSRNAAEVYERLREVGLDYEPGFRCIHSAWEGRGEAIGKICLPLPLPTGLSAYCAHPAMLDGAFQLLVAARAAGAPSKSGETFLPAAIERIDLFEPLGSECWVHARISRATLSEIEGDIQIANERGDVLLDIKGIRAVRVGTPKEHGPTTELFLHELRWTETAPTGRPRPPLPSSAVVVERLSNVPPLSPQELNRVAYSTAVQDKLNALAVEFIRRGLARLGCDVQRRGIELAEVAQALGIGERNHRLLVRLIQIVQAAPDVFVDEPHEFAKRLAKEHEYWAETVELICRTSDALPDVLRGMREPQEVLFSPSALPVLARAYAKLHTNRILAESVAIAVDAAGNGTRLRILEIGAGTGGATTAVLSRLPAGSCDYCFTDVSPFFLAQARERFADRPGLTFSILDIEEAATDSLPFQQFDLIIAANVMHGTKDLRSTLRNVKRLLAPDGLLVIFELVMAEPWTDLIFGMFQGWWRFNDLGLRPAHAVLNRAQWLAVLKESGFDALRTPELEGATDIHSVFVATPSTAKRKWMVVQDRRGVASRLAAALDRHRIGCVLVNIEEIAIRDASFAGIIYLSSVDLPGLGEPQKRPPLDTIMNNLTALTEIVRVFETGANTSPSERNSQGMPGSRQLKQLWLITAGAQKDANDQVFTGGLQSPVWAAGRVIMEEMPGVRCRLADLSAAATDNEIEALASEIVSERDEEELVFRDTRRLVARIAQVAPATFDEPQAERIVSVSQEQVRLEIDEPGNLESLSIRTVRPEPPSSDEILIRVQAAGLNFKDVMHSLGLIPFASDPRSDTKGPLGFECSGVVVAAGDSVEEFHPGDQVCCIATGTMASHVRVPVQFAFRRPDRLAVEDAAGVLLPFMTAQFGLHHVARIQAGERVLIHSAAGGVGLSALQICRNAGVEVFATAGTPEKRAFLESLGIDHVMDSRSLDFADRVLEITGGEGVDVVLNSLAGPAIAKGLSILRPFGRFIEIGKRDFIQNTRLELGPFERHLSFFAVDLDRIRKERPALGAALAREVLAKFAGGELQPLPRTDFDLAEARSAFRFMAQGKHIGKIVVTVGRDAYEARSTRAQFLFSPNATYLITGGLGGFGIATAQWLVEQGARHIVLIGRHAVPLPRNQAAFDALLATGAEVQVLAADVAVEVEVVRVLEHVRRHLPPLRGVFHEAMVLEDQRITELSPDDWTRVLAPKVSGAWNLHRLTEALDYFVLFSSATAVLGNVGQASYGASNAFLDALALHRATRGLPALSVAWGLLGDVGLVVDRQDLQRFFQRIGFEPLTAAEAFATLEGLLRRRTTYALPFRMNWSKLPELPISARSRYADMLQSAAQAGRDNIGADATTPIQANGASADFDSREALEQRLLQAVAKVLEIAPAKIDVQAPMINLGLDSLMAVELESAIKRNTGRDVAAVRMLQGLSVQGLIDTIFTHRSNTRPTVPSMTEYAGRKELPLAPGQRRFWFLQRLDPSSVAYNMALAIDISGPLDTRALEAAVNEVVRNQEALRATFSIENGEPVQWIAAECTIAMPLADISADPDPGRALERLTAGEARRVFDLNAGPLLSTRLVKLSERRHVLLATAHHLVVDAWSAGIISRQTAEYYSMFAAGRTSAPQPAASYSAFVLRQLSLMTEREAGQLAYWTHQLRDVTAWWPRPVRRIPTGHSSQTARIPFDLPQELLRSLEAVARRQGTTPFTLLLSVFELLLSRYTGQEDVCVGTPVANRFDDVSRNLVGCFVNTLAIRVRMTSSMTFRELVRETNRTVLSAAEHQDVMWERVVEHLNPPRVAGRQPILQALFVFHNFSMVSAELPGLVIRSTLLNTGESPFELMMLIDSNEGRGAIEFSSAFDPDTIASMARDFTRVLEDITRDADRLIAELSQSNEPEAGATTTEIDDGHCLHELFEEQASRTPDALAVISSSGGMTYSQLNAAADALSSTLRTHGVTAGTFVVIAMERSPLAVVSMLAVLKSGAAFVPVDVHWPARRVRLILEETRAVVILTEQQYTERFGGVCSLIAVDRLEPETPLRQDQALATASTPQDLAYVLYTSGSTGQPKGVMIEHAGICNQIAWRQSAFPLNDSDAILQSTPLTFDPSVWEIFGPLSAGAAIVIAAVGAHNGAALNHLIRQHAITTLQVVPSVLRALLAQRAFEGCRSLRRVFCGGEPMEATLRDRFFRDVDAEIVHLYGCTETAIDASHHRCRKDEAFGVTPIGRAIAQTRLYVVDDCLRPVPDGAPGELCVAGPGVGRGYLNDPDLTSRRFLVDPFASRRNVRVFLTGDIVRRLPGGEIDFLERRDRQLKVRGCRMDATEIEDALRSCPAVQEVAVGVGASEESSLIAWIVPADGARPSHAEMSAFLAAGLPNFMFPDRYVWVEALPHLTSGKIDMQQLPHASLAEQSVPPQTEMEHAVVQLWEEMLVARGISMTDNFFDLGGHSLLAVRLAVRMSELLGRDVRCRDVITHGTIAGVLAALQPPALLKHVVAS